MSNLFPKWTNLLPTVGAISAGLGLTMVVAAVWYYFTPNFWEVGYMPKQPVDYSHQIHAGQLGMDCRYCHTHVEESYHANVPSPSVCMNCHTAVDQTTGYLRKAVSADGTSPSAHWMNQNLARVRAAYDSGKAIEWQRVHKLPDYVQFPHAPHLKVGVSCFSCHGRIDEMPVVHQVKSLSMGFCLECHRNPQDQLIDKNNIKITDLRAVEAQLAGANQREQGLILSDQKQLNPPQHCGACHY